MWNEKFRNRPPHIFLGICSFQDIPHEIYESHMLWALQAGSRLKGKFRLSFGMVTRSEQYRARNKLIRAAQREGADFLLMIDDDQTLHENMDIVEKFWELGQPVAGGLYYNRGGLCFPVVMKEFDGPQNSKHVRFMLHEELPTAPAPVDVLGGGCHWVAMEVFDKLREPHFWPFPADDGGGPLEVYYPHPGLGLDVHFCQRVRAIGYECWLHPDIVLGHLHHERVVVNKNNIPAEEDIKKMPAYSGYVSQVYAAERNERAMRGSADG